MKCVLPLIALFGVAMAVNQLTELVKHEVAAIVAQQPGVDVDTCTHKCDALFDLLDDADETHTDHACHAECRRALTTDSSTHRPHHTNAHHSHHGHQSTTMVPTTLP